LNDLIGVSFFFEFLVFSIVWEDSAGGLDVGFVEFEDGLVGRDDLVVVEVFGGDVCHALVDDDLFFFLVEVFGGFGEDFVEVFVGVALTVEGDECVPVFVFLINFGNLGES
jgi:hypothetical protein